MKTYPFTRVAGLDEVYVARAGKLNCTAVRLRDGGMCLYSPVAGLEVFEHDSFSELGDVSAMIAPNHYHNKGLQGHSATFPEASLICSTDAGERLRKITGLAFDPLDSLKPQLAENQKILEPQGLKTGEVWLQIETGSETVWAVADAFTAKLHPPNEFAHTPSLLGTFPKYGIKDIAIFKDWVDAQFAVTRPTVLLPCHGSPVKARDLSAQLEGLLAAAR